MVAAVESMVFSGDTPWHGEGIDVSATPAAKRTPEFMLKKGKLDWKVIKRPLSFPSEKGKGQIIIPDRFALVRETDERPLTIVGGTYKPVQNSVSMDFFSKFVKAAQMSMETVGSLYNGQYIWGLARIGADFKLGKKEEDEIRGFLLLCNPHVFGKAMIIQFTPSRVVCWNTLTWALGADLKGSGKGERFSMPHSMEFDDVVKKRAEMALGLAKGQMEEFKQATMLLSKKKAKPEDVEEYFCEVLQFDPKAARKKGRKKEDVVEPRMLPKFRYALEHSPGAMLPTAAGTWWGALNAVTAIADHQTSRGSTSTNLRSTWLGTRAALKRRATELALKRAS